MLSAANFDPFATDHLIDLPDLALNAAQAWTGFHFETEPQSKFLGLADLEEPDLILLCTDVLKLDLENASLPSLNPSIDSSTTTSDTEDGILTEDESIEEVVKDIWNVVDLSDEKRENKLVSWDHFTNTKHEEPSCLFASEAAPAVSDLLLQKIITKTHSEQLKYVRPQALVSALFDLGLGRSSAIFQWSEEALRFQPISEDYTSTGLTKQSLQLVVDKFLDAGGQFRRLRSFGLAQSDRSPIWIALNTAMLAILDTIEQDIEPYTHIVRSLIQLQDVYQMALTLLGFLGQLLKQIRSISNDDDLIIAVMLFAERTLLEEPRFESIAHELVSRMLQPVLRFVESSIGMTLQTDNSLLQNDVVAVLLSPSTMEIYNQTVDTLNVLNENGYSIVSLLEHTATATKLRIAYSAELLVQLQQDTETHEQCLWHRILAEQGGGGSERRNQKISASHNNGNESDQQCPFIFESNIFIDCNSFYNNGNDSLQAATRTALSSDLNILVDSIASCYQAIDLSLRPSLQAQHRLLSYSALRLLLQDHKLIAHLKLLHRFQLLTDGTFVTKLSASLYDSDQTSGEGRRRMHTKTGLRLENRETWPPASSELRLALMGILTESMSDVKDSVLTDSVSFAIRDLSDDDLERCRDIDSIYALDFLRLNHKPPNSIIEAVITPESLEGYDKIFNQLLRLLRMQALVQSLLIKVTTRQSQVSKLINDEHKFKMEAQRFVSALAEYYQYAVIGAAWFEFEKKLYKIAHRLEQQDYNGLLEVVNGLGHIRRMHEDVLHRITRGMLLKRKQSEAKGIIDRLFEVILRFAALTSKPPSGSRPGMMDDQSTTMTITRLHLDFEMHMKALVGWLRAESGKAGGDGAEMFDHLLLKLDWNGYWSK